MRTVVVDAIEQLLSNFSDCAETFKAGFRSDGVYNVYVPEIQRSVEVYCDMTTDGGGWAVCIILSTFV